ncbi:helix-turn-helix transcriptional regulator [Bradyrhizobium sp. 160]|uniref:helix-turn-helix domain-containing protein n=1 Tax=unclassified Bradyrhizobium TaxID=2631580 RepID=UPI001FF784A4|nr:MULTISPECIES: helix-turn-helix transcriptional regulator [unclassified Bradyrhizobium]MCK1542204.1 helix-turn-helix transcriptional regulator [Bradyrhizobium sp. 179]MCK1627832.1 helix-turn-helix transcriptional regulator [Bradyrhizobium sp. 160]
MAEPIHTVAGLVHLFVERARSLGLSHREVDERAHLGEGYFSKLACGDRRPTAVTIEKLCGALQLAFLPCEAVAAQMGVCENDKHDDHPSNERMTR